jgi:hypothetical protein
MWCMRSPSIVVCLFIPSWSWRAHNKAYLRIVPNEGSVLRFDNTSNRMHILTINILPTSLVQIIWCFLHKIIPFQFCRTFRVWSLTIVEKPKISANSGTTVTDHDRIMKILRKHKIRRIIATIRFSLLHVPVPHLQTCRPNSTNYDYACM